ncbi:MAG: hypothetical protein HQL86_08780 [Magnetococcales bacterium]|nr:hypothetical protein [Magnetococcales bacterium]
MKDFFTCFVKNLRARLGSGVILRFWQNDSASPCLKQAAAGVYPTAHPVLITVAKGATVMDAYMRALAPVLAKGAKIGLL